MPNCTTFIQLRGFYREKKSLFSPTAPDFKRASLIYYSEIFTAKKTYFSFLPPLLCCSFTYGCAFFLYKSVASYIGRTLYSRGFFAYNGGSFSANYKK